MSTKPKQKKSKWGWAFLLNVIILVFLLVGFGREYVSNMQIEREIREREAERDALMDEQSETMHLIEQLSSEYYLEKEARVKQGLGKEGETVIIVQNDDSSVFGETPVIVTDSEAANTTENSTKWFYYFFDRPTFEALQLL